MFSLFNTQNTMQGYALLPYSKDCLANTWPTSSRHAPHFAMNQAVYPKPFPFVTKYGRQPACPVLFPTECSVQFLTECLSFPDFTMFVCHHIAQIENQRLMYNNWVVLGDALIVKPKSSIRLLCANMLFVICFPLIGNNGTPLLPQNVNTSVQKYKQLSL